MRKHKLILKAAAALFLAIPFTASATTFTGGPIAFNDTATSVPYPSTIVVAGLLPSLSSITLTLTNFTRSARCDDLDMLLVGPTGATLIVFSDVGGLGGVGPITIVLSDLGAGFLSDGGPLTGGTSMGLTRTALGAFILSMMFQPLRAKPGVLPAGASTSLPFLNRVLGRFSSPGPQR